MSPNRKPIRPLLSSRRAVATGLTGLVKPNPGFESAAVTPSPVDYPGAGGAASAAAAKRRHGSVWFGPNQERTHRYREALTGLNAAQKPGIGVPAYTRWVNRRLGRYAAAAAFAMHWTANAVTALSATFSLAAIALLVTGDPRPWVGVLVAILLATGYLLDSADGQVARLQHTGSPAGEWLDHVVDAWRTPAIHLAVLVGFSIQGQPSWVLAVVLGYCLVSVVEFMSQILAEQLSKPHSTPTPEAGPTRSFLLLPTDTGAFCWMFLLWGLPPIFVIAYTAMFAVNLLHTVISMRRKYINLRTANGAGPAGGRTSHRARNA
ncbi:CDP-alcohol phosphatidyltransferase family protein [Cryobacterium sp. TMT2-23]|uniref:CDP-alcohol phosphatidyltransferase family protein n=1 Tax=Cryobacterium sp. TMT2-23 TaxID=1259252 RepID=UPI001F547518|nr:CDP-alcohol phosphatidyltransferase family protein [Cryobacterium sp. TMT2-23]